MKFESNKLKGRIIEKFGSQVAFAGAMELNDGTLSKKLRGLSDWTTAEMVKACELLDIPLAEAYLFFLIEKY